MFYKMEVSDDSIDMYIYNLELIHACMPRQYLCMPHLLFACHLLYLLFALLAMFGVSLYINSQFFGVTVCRWFAGEGRAAEEGERAAGGPRAVRISVPIPAGSWHAHEQQTTN